MGLSQPIVQIDGTVTGSGVTFNHAAFPLATSIPFFTARSADGTATNIWDSYLTLQRLSETQTRVERRGNTGAMLVDFWYADESHALVQYFQTTALVAGNNDFAIPTPVNLAEAWVINLGYATEGDRDDDSGLELRLTAPNNARAILTDNSGNRILNFAVVWLPGSLVQSLNISSDSNESQAIPTPVIPGRTAIWSTARCDALLAWDSDEIDRVDLESANLLRYQRFVSGAGQVVHRSSFVVQLPPWIRVQRALPVLAGGVGSLAVPIATPVDTTRTALKVLGNAGNQYNMANNRNANFVCASAEGKAFLDSATQLTVSRGDTTGDLNASVEIVEWLQQAGAGAFTGSWV